MPWETTGRFDRYGLFAVDFHQIACRRFPTSMTSSKVFEVWSGAVRGQFRRPDLRELEIDVFFC